MSLSGTIAQSRDERHGMIQLVMAIAAGYCAPDGWGWTVCIALLILAPNRRVIIDRDDT